ncbi:MAG: LD-carboxypeptidase [Alphaproteobacteria bacterium]|nr:LD-carboxypeptidase [Alphaproteobacteria bacterium]
MSQLVSPAAFPPLLPKKGTIGVVAPSCLTESAWLEAMKRRMEARGYEVVIHDQCYLKNGALAGSDAARAEAINDMFADGTIDAVFCARGGNGSILLLDRLDYEMIRANPKPYVGFSDSTAIVNTLASHAGLVAYHGPMGWNFDEPQYTPETEADLFTMIAQEHEGPRCLQLNEAQVERGGQAQGRLVGGNMSLLQALIGTPYDWSAKDGILFIEDVEEPLYKLERVLTQMRLAGKFEGVRAVLVGEMIGILDEKPDLDPKEHTRYGTDFKDIVIKHLPPDVPLAFNVPCGHGRHLATFPVGAQVRVTLGQVCGMEVCE